MTKDEALKLALAALEGADEIDCDMRDAITAIKQAFAAPVQEPVAWAMYQRGRLQSFWLDKGDAYDFEFTSEHEWKPLYTNPPAAQPAPVPCCGQYETCTQACTPRGEFLAKREAQTAQPAPVQESVGTYGEIFESMLSLLRTGLQRDQQIYMEMKDKPLYTTPPTAQRPDVDALAALARADEREACAKVCEDAAEDNSEMDGYDTAYNCAAAIRNRGNT